MLGPAGTSRHTATFCYHGRELELRHGKQVIQEFKESYKKKKKIVSPLAFQVLGPI